jgi:hypothetical protein
MVLAMEAHVGHLTLQQNVFMQSMNVSFIHLNELLMRHALQVWWRTVACHHTEHYQLHLSRASYTIRTKAIRT